MFEEAARYIDLVQLIASDRGPESAFAKFSLKLESNFYQAARKPIETVLNLRNINATAFAEQHQIAERMFLRRGTGNRKGPGGQPTPMRQVSIR